MNISDTAHASRSVVLLVGVCLVTGCGGGARDLKLSKDIGRRSLVAFLDCWKQGLAPDSLESRVPPITGRDSDWDAGRKLAGYTIGSEFDDGTNLHITASLVFDSESGQILPRSAVYIVGTRPVITVFRDE